MSVLPDLFRSSHRSAIHLETRDVYQPDDPDWIDWREGRRFDPAARWPVWFGLVSETTARGVRVRRARIVSEPVTEYVKYEYDVTEALNLASGEDVRWLPRDRAVDLFIPAVDFWVFDAAVVVLNHHDGDGRLLREQRLDDSELAARYIEVFEQIWERTTPHKEYAV